MKLKQQQYQANSDLPEGAVAVTIVEEEEVPAEGAEVGQDHDGKMEVKKEAEHEPEPDPDPFINPNVLYTSFERSPWYYALRWMWCGCFEPRYKITSSYVIGEEWHGACFKRNDVNPDATCCSRGSSETCCVRVTDSMAFENVDDIQRIQLCPYKCVACLCCGKCFQDMGDIHLFGRDESNKHGWVLKRIHFSQRIFSEMNRIIQNSNAKVKKDDKKDKKDDHKDKKDDHKDDKKSH